MMQAVRVRHYLQRALDFLDGMREVDTQAILPNSAALLAIHSALSYCDALRVGLGDGNLSADDHSKAVDDLARLLPASRMQDRTGLAQLKELIAKKSSVSYGHKPIASQDLKALTTRAERFARWANNLGRDLKIEGWTDDEN